MRFNVTPHGLKVSALKFPTAVSDWDLVPKFLQYRKEVFVDRKEWALQVAEGNEFEQYDTFDTAYVIAHVNREVVGGARLKRTDTTMGQGKIVYSYMIRDACRGLLPGMPTDLCYDVPPVDPAAWELTRFAAQAPGVGDAILRRVNEFLFQQGAARCLALGSPAFMRMAARAGWPVSKLGPLSGNHDGQFLAFECSVMNPAHVAAQSLRLQQQPAQGMSGRLH